MGKLGRTLKMYSVAKNKGQEKKLMARLPVAGGQTTEG